MKKFIVKLIGVIAVTVIAKAILLWLGSQHQIYPEHWIANLVGIVESGVTSYPSISWILSGLVGLFGLLLGPYLYKLGLKIIDNDGAERNTNKSHAPLNEWVADESAITNFRVLSNEHTNIKIIFFDNKNFPFCERLAHAFILAGWEVNFNKTAQGKYNLHYKGGVEIKGDNRILVETIAKTLESSGCAGVKTIIGATEIKPDHHKYNMAQNKVWVTVGYET